MDLSSQNPQDQVLFAYCGTPNERFVRRLNKSLEQQLYLEGHLGQRLTQDRIFFSDRSDFPRSPAFQTFFEEEVVVADPYVTMGGQAYFALSKFRNASFSYALANGYEWLMLCDCDTIVAPGPFVPPSTRYGIPQVYWQRSPDETAIGCWTELHGPAPPPFAESNSWFIVHRTVMENVSFNESMFGYGWEDVEWLTRADLSGNRKGRNGTIVIHSFHEAAERGIDPVLEKRNRDITTATHAFWKRCGPFLPNEGQTRVVTATHRDWTSNLVFHPNLPVLYHAERDWVVEYEQLDDKIRIEWTNEPPELFELDKASFRQVEVKE